MMYIDKASYGVLPLCTQRQTFATLMHLPQVGLFYLPLLPTCQVRGVGMATLHTKAYISATPTHLPLLRICHEYAFATIT